MTTRSERKAMEPNESYDLVRSRPVSPVHGSAHREGGKTPPIVMNGQCRTPTVLRRAAASVAIIALLIGGAKVASIYSAPGSGFSTVQTAAADPTGPTGPGGAGMTGPPGGGSEFVPPSMPSMPDYTGGNQPPLDQNNGVSIYNSGVQSAPSQGNSYPNQAQRGQNPDGTWQTAANGEQQPIQYSTAAQYTGSQSVPNTAPPEQQSPQTGDPSSVPSQQPTQEPTQTQEQQNDNDVRQNQRRCEEMARQLGQEVVWVATGGGRGSLVGGQRMIGRVPPDPSVGECQICDEQVARQQYNSNQCQDGFVGGAGFGGSFMQCTRIDKVQRSYHDKDDARIDSDSNCFPHERQAKFTLSRQVTRTLTMQREDSSGVSTTNSISGQAGIDAAVGSIKGALQVAGSHSTTTNTSSTVTGIDSESVLVSASHESSGTIPAYTTQFVVPSYTLVQFTTITTSPVYQGMKLVEHGILLVADGGSATYEEPGRC